MLINNVLHDRHSQSSATNFFTFSCINSKKSFCNSRKLLSWNPNTVIFSEVRNQKQSENLDQEVQDITNEDIEDDPQKGAILNQLDDYSDFIWYI